MQSFHVTVKTGSDRVDYEAIAMTASDLYPEAYDRFGVCGVTVKPKRVT